MTYVGELGWELHIPTEYALGVFDTLMAAGEAVGVRLVGMHAMNSLRIEKAYRHWGHDITDEDTKFIPGHGPLSSRNELVSYKDMLVAIRDGIQAQIKQKKTLEEIIDSKPTKEFDEANKTFIPVEGFIKILYQDLSRDSQ